MVEKSQIYVRYTGDDGKPHMIAALQSAGFIPPEDLLNTTAELFCLSRSSLEYPKHGLSENDFNAVYQTASRTVFPHGYIRLNTYENLLPVAIAEGQRAAFICDSNIAAEFSRSLFSKGDDTGCRVLIDIRSSGDELNPCSIKYAFIEDDHVPLSARDYIGDYSVNCETREEEHEWDGAIKSVCRYFDKFAVPMSSEEVQEFYNADYFTNSSYARFVLTPEDISTGLYMNLNDRRLMNAYMELYGAAKLFADYDGNIHILRPDEELPGQYMNGILFKNDGTFEYQTGSAEYTNGEDSVEDNWLIYDLPEPDSERDDI